MSRILILVLSLAAGGGAAWLTMVNPPDDLQTGETAPMPMEAAAAQPRLEEVLVAAVDLEHRRRLVPADLQWRPWPEEALADGFITRASQPDALETLNGNMVRTAMLAGEPVRQERVGPVTSGFMSALLPPGKRAVAVRVSAETTAGGFILPDDRVDVLHTVTASGSDNGTGSGVSRTILTNIRVLAVDQQVDGGEGDAATVGRTATLELDPRQAEVVAAAEASGSLSLALRSSADNNDVAGTVQEVERSVRIISAGRSQIHKTE
jgi:pilus assembly protein CpaB